MNTWFRRCFVLLAALGLLLPACDRLTGTSDDEEAEAEEAEEEGEEEESEEEKEQKVEIELDAVDFTKDDYVSASYELACIDAELDAEENDELDMDEVKTDILGKYAFDEETYGKADKAWGEKDDIKDKIDENLEECDEEKAKKFAGLVKEEEKPKAAPKPKSTGSFEAQTSGQGFDNAVLKLNVSEDFKAYGSFRGKREKGFRIPFKGSVSKSNKISASGSKGGNSVKISGRVLDSGARVEVTGSVWDRNFSLSMSPK